MVEVNGTWWAWVGLLRRFVPTVEAQDTDRFFIRYGTRRYATPLFAAFLLLITADVLFAIESIPAIFAVTDAPFLVFASNAFALLGLHALYLLLDNIIEQLVYLRIGVAVAIGLAGLKLAAADLYEIHIWLSLTATSAILGTAIALSLTGWATRSNPKQPQLYSPKDT